MLQLYLDTVCFLFQWMIGIVLTVSCIALRSSLCIVLFISIALLVRYLNIILARGSKMRATLNRSILITGATSGIGLALSKFYHRLGFSIIATYYNDKEPGYTELCKLNDNVGNIYMIHMDISSLDSIQKARKKIDNDIMKDNQQMRLHCLINNAGIGLPLMHLSMSSRSMIERVCDTNLKGTMLTIREFMPLLIKGQGRIVNVSSGLAAAPIKLLASYSATKAASLHMTGSIMNETECFGVKSIAMVLANAMQTTNITGSLANQYKQSREEFNDSEQAIYKRLFDNYETFTLNEIAQLEEANTSVRPFDTLRYLTCTPPPVLNEDTTTTVSFSSRLNSSSIIRYLGPIVDGIFTTTVSDNLEDSSFLEAFEDAVRSRNPKNILYVGNRWYQFLFGPIIRWVPDALKDLLLSLQKPKKEEDLDDILFRNMVEERLKQRNIRF